MFGRLFFVFAGILSFCSILFFGYRLIHNEHTISAASFFSKQDNKVLIVNKISEIDLPEIEFDFPKNEDSILKKITASSFYSERLYISSSRNRIVVELKCSWNALLVKQYFKLKHISFKATENTLFLENGFVATFTNSFLVIGKQKISVNQWEQANWPTWDKLASCSILHVNTRYSQAIYFEGKNSISYQSNFKNVQKISKINDFELFASILPKGITNYHFISKEYALLSGKLKKEDLLYQWCEKGYVTFDMDGSLVLISDFTSITDPFELLNEETEEEEMVAGSKSEYDGIKISSKFPQVATGSIFIKYLEDKVVISENEEAVNQVLAFYETGRTVALSEKAKKSIYENLPSDVCERYIQDGEKFTKSISNNKLITVRKSQLFITADTKGTVTEKENIYTLDLTQNVSHIVSSNFIQICFTENSFFGLQNGKKLWEKPYQGNIIGTPVCQDLLNDGNSQIFFTTNSKIYLIDSKGNNYIGFPISLHQQPSSEAVFFDGKKGKQLIFVNTNNEVIKYNGKGKRLKSNKLSISPNKIAPFVFKNGKQNFAVISGKNGGQLLQLDNLSKQNTFPTLNDHTLFCTTETTPAFFYPEEGELIRNDFTGKKSTSGSYRKIELLQSLKGNTRNLISFLTDKNFHICDGTGKVTRTVALPSSNISFYQVLTLEDGSSIVGFLDNIENAIYLYTTQGKKINLTELEGQDLFCLSETPNGILVTTKGKNLIIQYKLDNK